MHRKLAFTYFGILTLVAALSYTPGVKQPDGTVSGVFALDICPSGSLPTRHTSCSGGLAFLAGLRK